MSTQRWNRACEALKEAGQITPFEDYSMQAFPVLWSAAFVGCYMKHMYTNPLQMYREIVNGQYMFLAAVIFSFSL